MNDCTLFTTRRMAMVFMLFMASPVAMGAAPQLKFLGQLQPTDLPPGAAFGGGQFERRIDVSGSLAVVGAGIFRSGADVGRAYVYDVSNPNNIQQIAVLTASDNSAGNEFGDGVAISGNDVFVGAWEDRGNRGAVYMYDVSDRNHVVERKITAFDAAPFKDFGFSLAVDGKRLVVGAPDFSGLSLPPSAYIVDFSNPDHLTQTKISLQPPFNGSGYGEAVDISGNYVIVGHDNDNSIGSAHLYDISNSNAIVEKRLLPTNGGPTTEFGQTVAISGQKALVSASSFPGSGSPPGAPEGTVWAFDFSNWNQIKQSEYGRSSFQPGTYAPPFGRGLELEGNLAVEGAFNESAVYFHDVTNVLEPRNLLRFPTQHPGDIRFGGAVAIDGQTLMVSDFANHVYLYRIVPEPSAAALVWIAISIGLCWKCRRWV